MTNEDLKARAERNFAIIDNLPQPVRALIHDHGAAKVVSLWQRGMTAAAIQDHFEEADVFDDAF